MATNGITSKKTTQQVGTERARVGGSGFTAYVWNFGGAQKSTQVASNPAGIQVISFMRQVSHTSPAPVGPGTVAIHPLDMEYPAHLITPQAISKGTLVFELYELVDKPAWQRLAGLEAADDLADIFYLIGQAAATAGPGLSITKYIYTPAGKPRFDDPSQQTTANVGSAIRQETYNGCVVSQLSDSETIEVGTMEVLKQITVDYAYVTRNNNSKTQRARGNRNRLN